MNPERWQKVKGILEEVLETDSSERLARLADLCGDDRALRAEVESLLVFEQAENTDLLEKPAVSLVAEKKIFQNLIGEKIGKYKIVRELGTGGMGAVFLGERIDGEFKQTAALKLIKRGMDSDAVLRRFYNERQILASLKHPNIAHLTDGGTTDDGLPYFVMEYVEGEPITEYADRANLSLEARLDLFREVCAAVSFAHQNLIIHRDLKPSNILIAGDGKVKLLDFGIAKLLKSDAENQTATQIQIFTPEYASPEQIKGENLTTATDVYSLGVILYELLTGQRPFKTESKNIGEIIKSVCESEPKKPSAVQSSKLKVHTAGENPPSAVHHPQLKGDLDNIVLKAIRKEPEKRYASVEQFAEDIRRYQTGLPVAAASGKWNYRASKFVRRNRFGIAAAGLILLTLLGGMAATVYQARIARRERERAEQRFNDVRQLANSFMFEINEQIQTSPIKARELLVERALEYLDKLAAESGNDPALESELAAAYEKIGNIQAEIFNPSAGKSSAALVSHQKSLEIRERLFRAEPNNINRGLDEARSRILVADILSMSGRISEASGIYRRAVQTHQSILALDEKNTVVRRTLAGNYARLGQSVLRSGSLGEAFATYEKAREIYQKLLDENPGDALAQRSLSIIFSYIGYVKIEMGEAEQAVKFFNDAFILTQKIVPDLETNQQSQNDLSNAQLWLGVAQSETGDFDRSFENLRRALELQNKVFQADQGNVGAQNGLADCYLELGRAFLKKARRLKMANKSAGAAETGQAIEYYQTAIENYEKVWQTDRQNLTTRRQIAFARRYLADALEISGEHRKSLEVFRKTLEEFENLTQADANNTEWKYDLAYCNLRIGEILKSARNDAEAFSYLEKARVSLQKLAADSPESASIRSDLEAVEKYFAKA